MRLMFDRIGERLGRILPRLELILFPTYRSTAYRIGIVLLLVTIAFFVRHLIGPPELGVPFLTFFPAAAISAVFGGFWAGMLATALGSSLATYFYIPPYSMYSFEFRPDTVFGNLVYVLDEIVVCSAIAALHRFYRVTKNQNAELGTLIQTIPDLIWLKNPEGVYLEFNPAIERFYGLRRDAVIGRKASDLFSAPVAKAIQRQDQAALAADRPQTNEAWVVRASDSNRVLLETTTTPMRAADGTLIGVLGIARDITASRLLEDQLRARTVELERERTFLGAIFNHTGDGILAADSAGTIELANQSARRLMGVTEGDERHCLRDYWPEWDSIASATSHRVVTRRDLEAATQILALSVTRTGELADTRYVIVVRDVSEEYRIADERRQLDRQMFQMENMPTLGELAMGVAHEIGNPLAGMKAVVQSLQYEDDLSADTREALRRLEAEIDRLSVFLHSFHGFAAPQKLNPESCCLCDIVEDTLFWIRKEAMSSDVAIAMSVNARLSVRADPNQIKQVLLNLAVNAIHAMPQGGALRITAAAQADNYVRIEVADTGDGIDADVQLRIFDPFFTTRAAGSGLGLAVVKKIVTEHGGRIEVQSQIGHGSCFILHWPTALMELPA